MIKEILPCINCITYPVCQSVYDKEKYNQNYYYTFDIYAEAVWALENRCNILFSLLAENQINVPTHICVKKSFNIRRPSLISISVYDISKYFYQITNLELKVITYFDKNENSFRILEGKDYEYYAQLKNEIINRKR